ncbi:unnamed protein product [Spirodela intermedia]|uniref:TFIIS N-terminal domain-containing protein n=1 Tax=Spirodela intermedia TaxID=51605 RepID=A0A7I8LN43_SPIIN|nr:unnamed protein product [Spirodela intermedia]
MALEDFFTLSEMKDGLANLVRVEELLSIMHNQKDSIRNIVGDAARQWATVANIIAATERKDCLDHFIRLNGLSYLNHWLQEAQKQSDDNSDSSTEELISATLRALERLPVERDASSASGIGVTIKQLHGYGRGENIQEKVESLSLKWSLSEDSDMNCQPADGEVASCNDGLKSSPQAPGEEQQQQEEEEEGVQSADPALGVPPSDDLPDEGVADESVTNQKSSDQSSPCDLSNAVDKDGASAEVNAQSSSPAPAPSQENLPTAEPVLAASGSASTAPSPPPEAGDKDADEKSDASDGNDASNGVEDMDIEVNMKEPSPCASSPNDVPYISPETSLRKMDVMGKSSDGKATGNEPGLKAEKSVESKISSASSKRSVNAKAVVSELKQGRSEIGLDYGEIDALEVARQVAIEVEREVVDYREPFCSSSPEVTSGGENMDSSSIDLAENTTRGGAGSEERNENGSSSKKDVSEDSSSKDSTRNSDAAAGVKKSAAEPASPKSVSSVHESVGNSEKKTCDFDLNEDFCSEEADCPMAPTAAPATNLSTPIPVAAPKGAAALPVTPLHFEGELGWRGSAATSAFRPASPRRTPDGERSLSGPKQKAAFFTIDLNIADGEDNEDSAVNNNLLDGRSSSIPSDKSSMEMSSRADRLKLDLNRSEDEDIIPNQASYWRPPYHQHHQNGNRCTSPASSSSSRQPSLRDFDLNDDPSTFDACGSSSLGISTSKESAAYRGYNKFEDPAAVTIMGSRMAVERRDLAAQQTQRATFSGSSSGLCLDSGAATRGASAPYPPMPPHGFSYHGLQMGPAMSILPPFYGPGSIPYMVDSSGTAVVPQILSSPGLGATGGSSGGSGGRPPFFMSVVGPPSGLNMVGGGGPRPGLDLNSGAAHGGEGGGGREIIGNFKHMQGSSGFMEDRVASASQMPAGSGMVLKRKEPECGWDPPYTFGCKQATSWQ